MTATMYFTFFIVLAVVNCQAQLLPGGVPLFNGGFLGQPLNLQYSYNAVPGPIGVPLSQKVFTRVPTVSSLSHPAPMTALKLGSLPGQGMIPMNPVGVNVSPLQLRSTDAKEKDQKATSAEPAVAKKLEAMLEEMKKETQKPEQQPKGIPADSIDPVDQETDEIPKQVLGASGSFSDGSKSPAPPKTRSPENGEGIPDLDYLSKAANPIDDFEKKVEKTAKKIGHEIKHGFQQFSKFFKGRAEGRQNEEESTPYNNGQSESESEIGNMKQPVTSSGLQKAMEDFQKNIAQSQLMQRYYGNQKSDGYYGNQYNTDAYSNAKEADSAGKYYGHQNPDGYTGNQQNSDVYSHGKEVDSSGKYYGDHKSDSYYGNQHSSDVDSRGKGADSAGQFWNSAAGVAKNVADSLIKESLSRPGQSENGASLGENNPISTLFNAASNPAGNFADVMRSYSNADHNVPNYENGIPAHLWKAVNEYVDKHAKNFANPEQQDNNEFLGTLHRQYGYGHGGYPGYYGNGHHGHQGHHEHHVPHFPYYPGSYQHGYYPRPGWQYGNGYYKRSPVEVESSNVTRNSRGLPVASDSAADVAETVFDFVRGIMDGDPRQIAHASVDMGAEIADATSDSDLYKRTTVDNSKNSTSARNARQMPQVALPAQSGDITKSAVLLAQSILARRPDQIANAGVNLGSGIAATANSGQRFFKRSDSTGKEDSSLSRSPRQMLPILPLPGLMSPVQTGIASTALNFAQGFVGANPKQGVIQPIVGGLGTSAGNLAQGLGLIRNQPTAIHGVPVNELGQIVGTAVNLAQEITQIAGAANNPGAQAPRYFKRSDLTDAANDTSTRMLRQIPLFSGALGKPAGSITKSALNLAQGILSRNPGQIANSGINMGTGIAGTNIENPSQGLPTNQFGQIAGSAMNLAQGIVSNNPDQIVNSGVNMGSGIATPQFFERSDLPEPQGAETTRNLRPTPLLSKGWIQPIGTVGTNSALNLAQGIVNGNPSQIANSGVNMGTGIAGATNGAIFNGPMFVKRSSSAEPQNATTTRNLRQTSPFSQGFSQSTGTITDAALNLAQSILNRNPSQIANSGVKIGTGIAGVTNGVVFNGPKFFKRSPDGSIWESATGLAGSIASTANVDPLRIRHQDVMDTAGTIWKAANNLFGTLGKYVITPINSDHIVGATKEGGSVTPSDLVWESVSDLAGNIAKVAKKPVLHNRILGASNPPGEKIVNSATTLAGRLATLLMNPNVFNNPNLDATDGKSANPLLTPVYLAGDIVGVALNPEAYRTVRVVKSNSPTQAGGYVQTNVPAVPATSQQQSTTP